MMKSKTMIRRQEPLGASCLKQVSSEMSPFCTNVVGSLLFISRVPDRNGYLKRDI